MIHLPPFTALAAALLYMIGKTLIPPGNRRARLALIVGLGTAGLLLMANAIYGLATYGGEWLR